MKQYKIQRGLLLLLCIGIMGLITFESLNQLDIEEPREEFQSLPLPKSFGEEQGREPSIRVYILERGAVIELPFETYLQGVVGGEMPNNWPPEALKAQAIIARTFTMDFLLTRKSKYDGADISNDVTEAQAWNQDAVNEGIVQAVEETRGQVVASESTYAKTWYHAHGGGKTAFAREGFGTQGEEPRHIKVVDSQDALDAPEEYRIWRTTFSKKEVRDACQQLEKNPGVIDRIEIVERGPSGRATTLRIGRIEVGAAVFRMKIGSKKMKSTLLDRIEVKKNSILIQGKGFGHGVGMSQWGALELANRGYKADQIIHYYFKNIDLVRLWD